MWECGLKQYTYQGVGRKVKSLLMWECGLKPSVYGLVGVRIGVTPYVGVWIETQVSTVSV